MSQYVSTIRDFALLIVDVLKTDRDALVIVTGDTGGGKSVFTWSLNRELAVATGVPFDPVREYIYERDEFNQQLDRAPQYSRVCLDEAVGLFYARDYHEDEQIALLKKLDRIRYRNLVLTMLIPNLGHLDTHIRNARVRYWVYIAVRKGEGAAAYAHAYIFQKESNPFNLDPWNLKNNVKLWPKGKIDRSPNYVAEIIFKNLPREEYAIYNELRDVKRRLAEAKEWKVARKRSRRSKRGEREDARVVAE